jgi:hypothetical protein
MSDVDDVNEQVMADLPVVIVFKVVDPLHTKLPH